MSDFEEMNGLEEFEGLEEFGDLDDLSEFSVGPVGGTNFQLAEDLEGFASGFPDWDLYPPSEEELNARKKKVIKK